ncbi:MAG TPA: PIN domain nuclease [Ktedonobacteraceae bacterium]
MSVKTIARVVGGIVALGIVVGVFIRFNVILDNKTNAVGGIIWENFTRWWWILAVVLSVLVALIITPYITIIPYRWARDKIRVTSAIDLVAAAIGLIVGLVISALLTITLTHLPDFWGSLLSFLGAILFCYLSVAVAVMRKNDLAHLFQSSLFRRRERDDERERDRKDRDKDKGPVIPTSHDSQILLDTSTIIDGRIADISQTGFIFGTLVVPRFVLNELQRIADSADTMRRNRGRRGLEILNRLQKDAMIPIDIIDTDVEGVADVDGKLVKMARDVHCPIITNDFNLNRVAELQGVKVLNINELANAIKPVLLPGEDIHIKIMQDGKELGQGVGYLDDGTMIVVENGRQYMNATVEVTVTRVLQTVAGRMIFAHPKQSANMISSPQPPAKQRQA